MGPTFFKCFLLSDNKGRKAVDDVLHAYIYINTQICATIVKCIAYDAMAQSDC